MTPSPGVVHYLEHPLAGFAIAAALCFYQWAVLRWGGNVFHTWFHERIADGGFMKQFRMLGSELSTISLAAMLKAVIDQKSGLNQIIHGLKVDLSWVFYAWFGALYVGFVFTPSVFVRYGLLERDRAEDETREQWALFTWRWTLIGWMLGFVNLHIALKLMVP